MPILYPINDTQTVLQTLKHLRGNRKLQHGPAVEGQQVELKVGMRVRQQQPQVGRQPQDDGWRAARQPQRAHIPAAAVEACKGQLSSTAQGLQAAPLTQSCASFLTTHRLSRLSQQQAQQRDKSCNAPALAEGVHEDGAVPGPADNEVQLV